MAKPGRPFTYHSEDEKPVTISFRIPKILYTRLQRYSSMYRQSISELVRDGLEWRLEQSDPRQLAPERPEYYDNTMEGEQPTGPLQDILSTLERQDAKIAALSTALAALEQAGKAETLPEPALPQAMTFPEQTPRILPIEDTPQGQSTPEPASYDNTVIQDQPQEPPTRHRGRQSTVRQPILDLLREHPEGLTAVELKVHLKLDKNIGDTLAGMVKNGLLEKMGTGKAVRYVVCESL